MTSGLSVLSEESDLPDASEASGVSGLSGASNVLRTALRASLQTSLQVTQPLSRLLEANGYRLYLVGGVVRDALAPDINHTTAPDIDCTTDALPAEVLRIVSPVASSIWTQGRRFGTIGCVVNGQSFEITTHRADRYNPASRQPAVEFSTSVEDDLYRRDFTINAMAVDTGTGELVDPCGGANDLQLRTLRTPLEPEISFGDDPLRMLRAARFLAKYHLTPNTETLQAVQRMKSRIHIVSSERVRDELQKLLMLDNAATGLRFLADTGLLARILTEHEKHLNDRRNTQGSRDATTQNGCETYPAAQTHPFAHLDKIACVNAEPGQRWAALLGRLPTQVAVAELRNLKVSKELARTVQCLLEACTLLAAWETGQPSHTEHTKPNQQPYTPDELLQPENAHSFNATDVRRLIHICPIDIDIACDFARSSGLVNVCSLECFEAALESLRLTEDVSSLDPPLTGKQVMETLSLSSGPIVGEALDLLQELTYELGTTILTKHKAKQALHEWASSRLAHADTRSLPQQTHAKTHRA